MIDRFKDTFKEEANELLNTLEQSLLSLDENPDDMNEIGAVFRAMHTIKGSAAMFGFQHISGFTHEIENILDGVRNGKIRVGKKLIDLTLAARDHIKLLLETDDAVPQDLLDRSEKLVQEFQAIVGSNPGTAGKKNPLPKEAPVSAEKQATVPGKGASSPIENLTTYRIRLILDLDIMKNGTRPLQLVHELSQLGDITIIPYLNEVPPIEKIKPEDCYVSWDFVLTTAKSRDDILDVFIFVEGSAKIEINAVDVPAFPDQEKTPLGKILIDRGATELQVIEEAVSRQRRLGTILADGGIPKEEIKAALEEQDHIKRTRQKVQQEIANASIRVSSEKLDILVDLVGELVTLQARLSQTAQEISHPILTNLTESFERLTVELRDNTMSVRMLAIGSTFSRFKRLVRDLSNELGKEAELLTEGADTELDKTVLERLNDPLVHLIRNCIDHGLEDPATRERIGKPRQGNIKLSAEHVGGSVMIHIKDDGRGLDVEAIRGKAIERGLIGAQSNLTESEISNLIFLPGFSTARQITSVSGRGVGLDVVKKEIDNLGGVVHIESEYGKGTTLQLEIPLTLAIIEGLLVRVGEEFFVCPLSIVEECLEFQAEIVAGEMIRYRDMLIPAVSLREIFGIREAVQDHQQVVVAGGQGQKLGIIVDAVIGDHQTVIKNLGRLYKEAEGISGATILGDGSVALILDVPSIMGRILRQQRIAVLR